MNDTDPAELAQTLFEEIGDAAFIVEPVSDRLLDVNPMAQRLTGLRRDELLRLSVDQVFRAAGDDGLARMKRALHTTQTFHSREGYHLRRGATGDWVPVNLTLTRLHTERRSLGLILARDASERVRAEERLRLANAELEHRVGERTADLARANEALRAEAAGHAQAVEVLRASERRYRLLFERNMAGVLRNTPAGAVLEANDAFARILGYESGQALLGHNVGDFYYRPGDRRDMLARLTAEGSLSHYEVCFRHTAGTPVWVLATIVLYEDDPGRMTVLGTVIDITERKRTEEVVRRSAAGLARAQRIARLGDWEQELDPDRLRWSDEVFRIFGVEPAEFSGTSDAFFRRVHPA
ncbi:MAG TPA: PAS domain S-box protein, partial [Urbifossiella sp.]|nr:PAS domain S-box protein [Urbifossiella sp.]